MGMYGVRYTDVFLGTLGFNLSSTSRVRVETNVAPTIEP